VELGSSDRDGTTETTFSHGDWVVQSAKQVVDPPRLFLVCDEDLRAEAPAIKAAGQQWMAGEFSLKMDNEP